MKQVLIKSGSTVIEDGSASQTGVKISDLPRYHTLKQPENFKRALKIHAAR